ncbi:MAG: MCE family protein [Alphaproteobacteria bacterium]|nr:MCE family protein [Alphaproteobacteria bacterium]
MIKQPNMKLIGLFVLLSLTGLILMFGYFFKSKFSNNETTVVMYFDESVKGLEVGAPVLFKGVKIGEVSSVRLQADLQTMKFLIPVYAKIYNGKSLITNTIDEKERLQHFIDDGLRAQLAINSMLTGQLLIELDMLPETKVVLHSENDRNEYEIPTVDSPFAEISKKLQVIPIAKIAQDIHAITTSIESELPHLLKRMNETLSTVNTMLSTNKNNTNQMITQVRTTAQSLNSLINENAASISNLIDSFSAAAASMKNLTDYLQMNPSSIITGKDR